jgi:hypothetical protein
MGQPFPENISALRGRLLHHCRRIGPLAGRRCTRRRKHEEGAKNNASWYGGAIPNEAIGTAGSSNVPGPCQSARLSASEAGNVAEFSKNWKDQVIGLLKPSTANVMTSHLRFHLVPAFGRLRLDEIGQEQVQMFVGKLAKGRSRRTILNVLGTLASVLRMARKWGYVVAGFQHSDLVIPCSKPGKPGRFFTAEQVRSILALAS